MRLLTLLAWASLTLFASCTYECNASSCSDGCCGASGVCYVGGKDPYCGLGGATCADCSAVGGLCGTAGSCVLPCVEPATCAKTSECCGSSVCFEKTCVSCRGSGETCDDTDNCCANDGPNGRKCVNPSGYLWICR